MLGLHAYVDECGNISFVYRLNAASRIGEASPVCENLRLGSTEITVAPCDWFCGFGQIGIDGGGGGVGGGGGGCGVDSLM